MIPQKVWVCYCNIRMQNTCSQARRFIDMLRQKKNKAVKLFEITL